MQKSQKQKVLVASIFSALLLLSFIYLSLKVFGVGGQAELEFKPLSGDLFIPIESKYSYRAHKPILVVDLEGKGLPDIAPEELKAKVQFLDWLSTEWRFDEQEFPFDVVVNESDLSGEEWGMEFKTGSRLFTQKGLQVLAKSYPKDLVLINELGVVRGSVSWVDFTPDHPFVYKMSKVFHHYKLFEFLNHVPMLKRKHRT